jgi:protoporphyrinogen oxidase
MDAMTRRKPVIGILGAGVMGLASGLDLLEEGYGVVVFESAPSPGGLAASFDFGDIRAEKFYHFICGADHTYVRWLRRLGLSSRLKWRRTTMAVFRDGRLFRFGDPLSLMRFPPLSPLARLRYGYHVLKAKRLADWRELEHVRAMDWLVEGEGEEPYRVIWEPLLRRKFGEHVEDLSAAWIWSRIHRLASSRDGLFQESLGLLEGGTDVFIEALGGAVQAAGGQIRCGEAVDEILLDGPGVAAVRASGVEHPVDALLSTVPLPILSRIGASLPDEYRRAILDLPNLGVRCVLLKLRAAVSPHFWINVNDDDLPLCGLIEHTNLHPPETFGGYHLVYSPMYVSTQDPEYGRADDEVLAETLGAIARIEPGFDPASVADFRVFRAPHAQPVCPVGFTARLAPIRTPVPNLIAGDTSHLLPHDRSISDSLALSERLTLSLKQSLNRGKGIGEGSTPFAAVEPLGEGERRALAAASTGACTTTG